MGKYLVGIDSGTQSTRVIIFSEKGELVSKGVAKHPALIAERQGWAEHGEMDAWVGLCEAARNALEKFDGSISDIIGIGLSSQRGTTLAVDEKANIIQRPISWMDARMAYGIQPMPDDTEPLYKFLRYYSKANWCKVNKPDVFDRAYKWLTIAGYLGYRMCGEYVDTIANQSGGWPIDQEDWCVAKDDWKYECVGVRRDQLAKMFQPGEVLGRVTKEAAQATGFPEGCPVVACAGDKQGEVLGAGCIKPGQIYITFGTSASIALVGDARKASPDMSFICYLSCVPGIYNYEAGMWRGYWLISWFRDNLGMDLAAEAKASGKSIEQLLNEEAADVPAGSEGLVIIPDWQAPSARPKGKGMMIGFDDRHGRKHMFRAMIEGISQQLKINSEVMAKQLSSGEITELFVGGGGSQSPITTQATADIFNVPVKRSNMPETCSLGAAICAAVGAKVYPSFDEAVRNMVAEPDVFYPIPENQKLYEELREKVHKKVYPAMAPILSDLIELTKDKK